MTRNLSVFNLLSVVLLIIVSYYSQVIRINDNTIGGVSDSYSHLFTPADYAFSIWGLIFLALLIYCLFQINRAFVGDKDSDFVEKTGPWFILANVCSTAWVIAWLYEEIGLSVLLMFGTLLSLIAIIRRNNMERWDAPLKTIVFSWWPICLYSGWITVATITNVAAWLTTIGWNRWFLDREQWTVVMLVVVVIINILIIYRRNMREFAAVGVWALYAIYDRHSGGRDLIAYTALLGAVVLLGYICYHAYLNRKSNPMYKLVKGSTVS